MHTKTPSGGCSRPKPGEQRRDTGPLYDPGIEGIDPFPLLSNWDGPGFPEDAQDRLFRHFGAVRVARMAFSKEVLRRSGSVTLPWTRENLHANGFVRLVGPVFANIIEVEIDQGPGLDLSQILERLSLLPTPPNLLCVRTRPKPPKDANGHDQADGLGNLHVTWLLSEASYVKWEQDEDGKKHWSRQMYERIWRQLTDLLHGDRGFRNAQTRCPWYNPDKSEYRAHWLHDKQLTLFELRDMVKLLAKTVRDLETPAVETLPDSSRQVRAAGTREIETIGGPVKMQGGDLYPMVVRGGLLQRNDWAFEHGRRWGYALARRLVDEDGDTSYKNLCAELEKELRRLNAKIPAVNAAKGRMDDQEVLDVIYSIAGYLERRYVPAYRSGVLKGSETGTSTYAREQALKAHAHHPELREKLRPELGQAKIHERNVAASSERDRRIQRVGTLLLEGRTRRQIRDVLMEELSLDTLSESSVKGYVREARKRLGPDS